MSDCYQLRIYRFNPEQDKQPYMQEARVDKTKVNGIMLLDLLKALKEQDASIAFRHACGAGVCGSDGMNISGKNGLACITPLSEAIRKSFQDSVNRVWVHTCSLDHKNALNNYMSRGMRIYKSEILKI